MLNLTDHSTIGFAIPFGRHLLSFVLLILTLSGGNAPAFADQRSIELGIGLHLGLGRPGYENSNFWLQEAGFNSIRDEIFWSDLERVVGRYELDGRAKKSFENYLTALNNGMKPLLLLNYGNKLYGGGHPATDESRAAFSKYVIDILGRFPVDMPYVELWNEWNIGAGTSPRIRSGSVDDYLALARVVVPEIRRTHPKSKIILGGLGDDLGGWPWLRRALDKDILASADGISVHLYNHSLKSPSGGAVELFERLLSLQRLLRTYNNGAPFPIYITETGYPNSNDGLTEQESSEQLMGYLLAIKLVEDVKGVWIYEFKDGGVDKNDREQNFGILNFDKSEKSLACRLRQFSKLIRFGKIISSKIDSAGVALIIEDRSIQYFVAVPRLWGARAQPVHVNINGTSLQSQTLSDINCADDLARMKHIKQDNNSISLTLLGKPLVFRIDGKVSSFSLTLSPSPLIVDYLNKKLK